MYLKWLEMTCGFLKEARRESFIGKVTNNRYININVLKMA
jgi:hypothetical protein